MNADRPTAADAAAQQSGVRRVLAAFGRRLVAVEQAGAQRFSEPLDAPLLGRHVGQAAKAVTSHRTPNLCRPCADFRHCSTELAEPKQIFAPHCFVNLYEVIRKVFQAAFGCVQLWLGTLFNGMVTPSA